MVAAVGDHAVQLGVEPPDDRLGVRKRPADGEVKRACKQRRRAKRQPCSSFFISRIPYGQSLEDFLGMGSTEVLDGQMTIRPRSSVYLKSG